MYWKKEEIEVLKKLWNKNLKVKEIKKDIPNRTLNAIENKARILGLRRRIEYLDKITRRKYYIKENFFKKENPEMAYTLGFIIAEANKSHIKGYKIKITQKDNEILRKMLMTMNSNYPIHKFRRKTSYHTKKKTFYYIIISSKEIFEDLTKRGVEKSFQDIKLKNKYFSHFLRGYLDGDGTLGDYKLKNGNYRFQIGFAGTRELLRFVDDKIYQLLGIKGILTKQKNCKNLYQLLYAFKKARILGKWIYEDATIYWSYKKNRFDNYLKRIKDINISKLAA